MKDTIPTLTIDGYCDEPVNQMTKLFEYYQVCDYSQSNSYKNEMVSLSKTLQEYGNDMPDACNAIKADLIKLYSRHFENVNPEVFYKEIRDGFYAFTIEIRTYKNAKNYELKKELIVKDNILVDINSMLGRHYNMYGGKE